MRRPTPANHPSLTSVPTPRNPKSPASRQTRSATMMSSFSKYTLIIAGFFLAYVIFTLHLVSIQHQCPTLEQLSKQDENRLVIESIQKIADSADPSRSQELIAPLAKLGIRVPLVQPPLKNETRPDVDLSPVTAPTTTKTMSYANEHLSHNELLDPTLAAHNVFYVWCGKRWFEFQHYLSVMSVIREIRPDNIIFFYDYYPVMDSWTYNTWFDEIRDTFPFFRIWKMDLSEVPCTGFGKVNQTFIGNLLSYRGGIYVHENTIFDNFPLALRNNTIVHALDPQTKRGFALTQRGFPGRWVGLEEGLTKRGISSKTLQCSDIDHYIQSHRKPLCVSTDKPFYPKDIWDLDNSFGRLVRKIFYKNPDVPVPRRSSDDLIPNIAHVIWLGGGKMDYLFYLCVLSLVYVAEVDRVYIHGDSPPTGKYWESLRHEPRITLIYRDYPGTVYGTRIEVLSHVTDVWRVDFMIKYGGIYVDTDTVFVKPLDRDIRSYDAVGAYDWTDWNPPFPDTINFGVAIGKKNAPYWHVFQKSMKWFMDNDWSWNGLRQPYRIKERHPDLVKIDPHLQVICFEMKCHPTWYPGYHNESLHHLNSPSIQDWRTDAYAFHWTLPTPDELQSEEQLLASNTIFAEIGRHVLEKAGRLPGKGG